MTRFTRLMLAAVVGVAVCWFLWWLFAAVREGQSARLRHDRAAEQMLAVEYQVVELCRVGGLVPLRTTYILRGTTRTGHHDLVVTSDKLWFKGDWIRVSRLPRGNVGESAYLADSQGSTQSPIYGLTFEKAPPILGAPEKAP